MNSDTTQSRCRTGRTAGILASMCGGVLKTHANGWVWRREAKPTVRFLIAAKA